MEFKLNHKKIIIYAAATTILVAILTTLWTLTMSPTKITLVNFKNFQASNIALSNSDRFIKFTEVDLTELDKIRHYDFVLGNGMGLKIDETQRETIKKIAAKVPTHFIAVTNPENEISNLNDIQLQDISSYLDRGNRHNYQNFARYVRFNIDKKKLFSTKPELAIQSKEDVYFSL